MRIRTSAGIFCAYYSLTFDINTTHSTWHERTKSTSFTGRFIRLDPRRFLSSRSYVGTYHIILIINSFSETTFFKLLSATTRAWIISSYFFLLYICTFDTWILIWNTMFFKIYFIDKAGTIRWKKAALSFICSFNCESKKYPSITSSSSEDKTLA